MNPSSQSSAPPKKSKGRQKISMVKMEKQSNLQVTFSKRRAGLFKKASELCTLCDAEAAIVVFSPAEKAYCFGHPNVTAVIEKFGAGAGVGAPPTPANPRNQLILEAHRNSTIRQLNAELTRVESLLRAEKRRSQEVEAVRKAGEMQWLPSSLDGYSYAELGALKDCIMEFEKNLDDKVRDMAKLANNNNPLPNFHQQIGENPNGFNSLGGVPTFGDAPKLPLGTSDFSSFSNGGLGFGNPGFYAPNTSVGVIDNFGNGGDHGFNQMASMFFGGGSSSSSENPVNPNAIGNGGFGFDLGHDLGLY